ncbi:hypothetical protein RKE29_04510 [Streptomyces sp. B1866]|uniref:hypothetical protein n=1 Tax=Streptomyces sp. B1866 TaxID=3075431 RepID=UPI0028922FEC|nr:hypothetical protein [Streptomyces sp. B1866]MDT3395912.1 hypothetical protein [Streptomyces sp. B1866]
MYFAQTSDEPLLFTARDDAGTESRRILYLLPKETANPPERYGFDESWQAPGVYVVFADPLPAGRDQRFAQAAWAYLSDPAAAGTRFLWLAPFREGALLSGTRIAVRRSGQHALTSRQAVHRLGSVSVVLPARSTVEPGADSASFTFTPLSGQRVRVTAGWGGTPVGTGGASLSVPLWGTPAGCLRFALTLTEADLTALDAGLRYYYADPEGTGGDQAAGDGAEDAGFDLASYRYPVFAFPGSAQVKDITVYAQLNPLAPLDADRSYLAFDPSDAGQTGPAPAALASYYRTTLGHPVTLEPLGGATAPYRFAALVAAVRRETSTPTPRDPLCFVPAGDFALTTKRSGADLMCGLSGVEYVALSGHDPVLTFAPGQPAYATGFLPGKPPNATSLVPREPPTTAYGSVSATDALGYYAQPDQSVLYNRPRTDTAGAGDGVTTLGPVPVLAATLPARGSSQVRQAPPMPLLPYAGLGGGGPVAGQGQLESQVVSPARRRLLLDVPPSAAWEGSAPGWERGARPEDIATGASAYSTTPQGLLAKGLGGGTWERVVLGQMRGDSGGAGPQLAFHTLTDKLLAAFQSNKMFLVATDGQALRPYLADDDARVLLGADPVNRWTLDLSPGTWQSNGTVLILKFTDKPMTELVRDTSLWASPEAFNASPGTARKTLQDILEGVEKQKADPDYADLWTAVSTPHWNGILAFGAKAPLDRLPPQLAGLAAGIDASRFRAHHLGITAAKINVPAEGDISVEPSDMFGLVDYTAQAGLPPGRPDYRFQVAQLRVLFRHSDVASFSSTLDFQVNALFGESATLQGTTDNVVHLYGTCDRHATGSGVEESYSFQTRSGEPSVFTMAGKVLTAVRLARGQFVTVTPKNAAGRTEARFLFWGLLDFAALDGFDAFSFGREPDAKAPDGLAFGGLTVGMTFDPQAARPDPVFSFDAAHLSFDRAASTARESSPYRHLPLALPTFTQAKEGATPTGEGFLGVQTPLSQSALEYPWYSLDFDLDLGTPGALAAAAGFTATLTVAWSPTGGAAYSVFTGLRLPGASGSKRAISVQGLFDITFKTLEILRLGEKEYVLVLYGIGLRFFVITFPPTGQVDFVLFGDPGSESGGTSLGWYAAYAKPDGTSGQKALSAGA